MARLRWSPRAADDLDEICRHIARDSGHYAKIFARRVMRILREMAKERLPGSMVPEYGHKAIRERLLYPYRIIVRVQTKERTLEVVRIVHGARQLPPKEE